MAKAVKIPVTVKMRAGWNDGERNAPTLARMVEDAGAAAVAVHGRTAAQSYSGQADWELVADVAGGPRRFRCSAAATASSPNRSCERMGTGVSGRARRPRRAAQSVDSRAGGGHRRGPAAARRDARGARANSCSTTSTCWWESGFASLRVFVTPHRAHARPASRAHERGSSHDRWVINKIRALATYYTKGFEHGSHLRTVVNRTSSLSELRELIECFFASAEPTVEILHS